MFSAPKANAAYAVPNYSGIPVSTSQWDIPIAWFRGRRRIGTNLMDYVNFQAKSASGKKGVVGKSGKSSGQKSYSASVVLGICRGPIDQIKRIFSNGSTTTTTTLAALIGSGQFLPGTTVQTPWSYLTTNFPTHALAYRRTAYFGIPNMNLGSTPNVPDNQPEADLAAGHYTHISNGWIDPASHAQDADAIDLLPSDCLSDLLTDVNDGFGISAADFTANLAFAGAYARAQGIFFSPYLKSQEKCTSVMDRWAQLWNTWVFWNGTQIDFCPLGDSALTANGVTYTPNTTVQAVLSLANGDFIGDPPVTVTIKDPADCYNRTRLDFTDRTLGYITNPIEYKDQTLVDEFGLRDNASVQGDEICDPVVAATVVQLIGKRAAYIRKTVQWKSSHRRFWLTPGDLVLLNEPNLGLVSVPVRLTDVKETTDQNGAVSYDFQAEEYPGTIGKFASTNPGIAGSSNVPDQFARPVSVNNPAVIEPDSSFTGGKPVLVISASWDQTQTGSAAVFVSFDGTNYNPAGTISAPSVQGVLTGNLADHVDPDNTNTLSVDTSQSQNAVSTSVTHSDADNDRSLCLICQQPSGSNPEVVAAGELLSIGTVAATGTYTANLTYLRRAQYGTAHSVHSTGDQFTMVDVLGVAGTSVAYGLPPQYIGVPIFIKIAARNLFGNEEQDLSLCTEYQYTPTGLGYGTGMAGGPSTPTGLSATAGVASVSLSWNANPAADNVTGYLVYRAVGTGASFGSSSVIQTINALGYTDTGLGANTGYTYFLIAQNAAGDSGHTAGVNATTATTSQNLWNPCVSLYDRKPDAGEILFDITLEFAASLPLNLTGSGGGINTAMNGAAAATSNAVFTLYKNGVSIGTAAIPASTTGRGIATFSFASAVAFSSGDSFQLQAPVAQDPTLQGFSFSFLGTR